jgi:RNA polymerase sigma-70 factor (ECF subfamily)
MIPMPRSPTLVGPPADAAGEGPLSDHTDDELMLLARGGIEGAFDTLIRRHQQLVLRLAFRYGRNAAWAADVAQNTFVEIYRALPRYRAHGKFKAYLYQILLNQCRRSQRSARTELRALDILTRAPADDAPAEVLAREQRREVEAALDTLSAKLREVVLLRFGSDLRYKEIAELLEIPVGTVKRRLFVAIAKLRDELEPA